MSASSSPDEAPDALRPDVGSVSDVEAAVVGSLAGSDGLGELDADEEVVGFLRADFLGALPGSAEKVVLGKLATAAFDVRLDT